MKTINKKLRQISGYALIMVMIIGSVGVLALTGSMRRTSTGAVLNDRNNQYIINLNAAEAAVEKVVARMAYDFQGGLGTVAANYDANIYRDYVPTNTESAYWNNFQFINAATGKPGQIYVSILTNYAGPLPSQYPGLFTVRAPVYRVLSNVKASKGRYLNMTNAVQEDVLLALLPLTQYAIFYHGLLEFSTCATMSVNGRTHANNNIYVGSSSTLTFNGTVTASGNILAPANNGSGPWTPFPSGANVNFNGSPNYKTNVPAVSISMTMSNTHTIIDRPPSSELVNSASGQLRLYNQAAVVLLVSNLNVTTIIQASPGVGQLPASDPAKTTLTASWTNGSSLATIQKNLSTNFPFLNITNTFLDQRESKTNKVTQIDVGKYANWLNTNSSVLGKYSAAAGTYPLILYVSDERTNTSTTMTSVRLTNGIAPPRNNMAGWSVATPNPLYVWGNYNCTNAAHLGTSNTLSTVPCAFLSDALTILSSSWSDSASFTDSSTGPTSATANTVNAAIVTGIMPSTSTASSGFSGGVHNLPRLLENWGSATNWLNTSIINLFDSQKATGQFITPGSTSYYTPPTRKWSFDPLFLLAERVPPGIPCALVTVRMNWAVPPAGKTDYYASP